MFFKHTHWIGIFVFLSFLMPSLAHAQTKETEKNTQPMGVFMAVLDRDVIFANAKAMKNIHEQLAKYQAEMQSKIDKEKAALEKDEDALNRQRSLLAPENYAEKRKEFQSRIVAFQRSAQEMNLQLSKVRAQATSKVTNVVLEMVQEIVNKNHISIVFHKNLIVVSDPTMDITNLVLEGVDKRLPSVQVENPMK